MDLSASAIAVMRSRGAAGFSQLVGPATAEAFNRL